ncbi:hypothetical protein L596_010047 [Steinernema carpocapsae]|uniref:Uncharacterized protein n=1 Tax=Steinernema carpocapsae TaxID=34508 RepID=A0A4U5PH60_STECR|nr:hypothetical protein L596_010047 [Steinernema carpocapsae]
MVMLHLVDVKEIRYFEDDFRPLRDMWKLLSQFTLPSNRLPNLAAQQFKLKPVVASSLLSLTDTGDAESTEPEIRFTQDGLQALVHSSGREMLFHRQKNIPDGPGAVRCIQCNDDIDLFLSVLHDHRRANLLWFFRLWNSERQGTATKTELDYARSTRLPLWISIKINS